MKVLVISLLRVGDLVMHKTLLAEVQKKNPTSEIHILINDVSQTYSQILPTGLKIHVFPRLTIQKHLIEENRSIFRGYDLLATLVESLNNEKFDKIINLTHSRLSARFMDLLNADDKRGVCFKDGKRVNFKNKWLHFMNEQFSESHETYFHYLEVLGKAVGLSTDNMLTSARNLIGSRICLQVLTSDPKKNWPIQKFVSLANSLITHFPEKKITVLASPDDQNFIQTAFENTQEVDFKFVKWKDLKEIFDDTALLITGDTSVQHIAAEQRVPLLSLFMGSANPRKTAPYLEGAVVLQSCYSCAPCHHSAPCIKISYDCVKTISVEEVLSISVSLLTGANLPLSQNYLFRVQKNGVGRFTLRRTGGIFSMSHVQTDFEQMIWQMYLDGDHAEVPSSYGSFTQTFINNLQTEFKSNFLYQWLLNRQERNEGDQFFLEEIDSHLLKLAGDLVKKGNEFEKNFSLEADEIKNTIHNYLIGRFDSGDYFFQLKTALQFEGAAFIGVRRVRVALQEAKQLLEIENKFTRTLIIEFRERGYNHVTGTRAVSEYGPAAT